MKRIVFNALLSCVALGVLASDEATLSEDGTVLTIEVASGEVWTNSTPVPDSVTTIVKNGGGEACFLPITDTTSSRDITINAGYLSGGHYSFGKPSSLTIKNDAAILFLDKSVAAIGGGNSPFYRTVTTVSGHGPDGYGAIQRPLQANAVNCLFGNITLAGATTFNCAGRWGLGGGTGIDMGGNVLTLSAAKQSHRGETGNGSKVFQLALGGNVSVKNPGAIVVASGTEIRIQGGSKLTDMNGSSGSVADMTVTLESGATFVFSSATNPSEFRIATKGTSYINVEGESYFNGTVDNIGSDCQFGGSGILHIGGHGKITGGGKIQRVHDNAASLVLEGGGISNPSGAMNNNGFWNRAKSPLTVAGNAQFAPHGLRMGLAAIARPAYLILKDNALFAPTNGDTTAEVFIGGVNRDEGHCGVVRVMDNAVYSNDCFVGYCGRGAVYVEGGTFLPQSRHGYEGLLYVGKMGYGYVGLDAGVFRHRRNLILACDDDEGNRMYGRGFFVQRGGRAEHLFNGRAIELGICGNNSYAAYAQFGGTCVSSNDVVFGYRTTPDGYGSTGVMTVSGAGTVMDMSSRRILAIASTNTHLKATTAIVNVNDGGTLKVMGFHRTLISAGDNSTPDWSTLDADQVSAASRVYLNINGGVIVPTRGGYDFFYRNSDTGHSRAPTRVTVYEKGAVVDTDGKDAFWSEPVLRPHGRGIRSVALPTELNSVSATNLLIGPTRCWISDSTGYGADVMLDYSNATRRVHGVIVTSPGCGYSSSPAVYFEKQSQMSTTKTWVEKWECPSVETVDYDDPAFVHGGFTKRGEGTLTLASSNTWGGVTRIEGGALALQHAEGYPGGDLEISSVAIMDRRSADAPILSAASFALDNGSSVRITEADTVDWKALARPHVLVQSAEPLAAMPPCEFVDSSGESFAMPFVVLSLKEGGTKLTIAYNRGTTIIFR